ncbi:SDR family oxidoreductase [Nocardia sp. CA-120079]|uniref:SDR family oxidoreductase n=1 Tax=Nocardia sp. CA-120079 TaxID=3239974 RepID=UPI003D97F2C3
MPRSSSLRRSPVARGRTRPPIKTPKGGAVMLVRTLAKELASLGRANRVCSGPTTTDKTLALTDTARLKRITDPTLLGGVGGPRQQAMATLLFAGEDASCVAGVDLPVDDGIAA